MFYINGFNPKSKKELKEAVKAGRMLEVYRPGFGDDARPHSTVAVAGPRYPAAHKWYAEVKLNGDCQIVSVK